MTNKFPGYKIVDKIYESSRTRIYRGIQELDSKPVVLKTLIAEYPSISDLARFKQEHNILKRLNIKGIIQTLGLKKFNNRPVLILEDFNGYSLKEYIKIQTPKIFEFLNIAIKISKILKQIHDNNIIHKDINPKNILINYENEEIKIIDFNISSYFQAYNQNDDLTGVLEGTLPYISPEQTGRMNRCIDYRTDFYSLGVTFYEMLTGRLPFNANDTMELIHCHIAKLPVSIKKIKESVPDILVNIIMKLLFKNAEDRYQSAYGLLKDFEKCLDQLNTKGVIEDFVIAEHDICVEFSIPQKLYGREVEINSLLKHFENVCSGKSEIVLVAGHSGVGKTAIIGELDKPIVKNRGYLISGKFDQYNQNIPYSAIIQAFQEIIHIILTQTEDQVSLWKGKILSELSVNSRIIIDVIPDLALIVGEQPEAVLLGPRESQNRFNLVLKQFISIFAKKEHPLALFLDDLQWADPSTINLLNTLFTESDIRYLLIIGSYRDNFVHNSHPLQLSLNEMKDKGVNINNISLSSLNITHINQMVSETLNRNPKDTISLSELVLSKTNGNPFFIRQFLKSLNDENLIELIPKKGNWQWDLEKIFKVGITDNVVDLMVGRIQKLPKSTVDLLKIAACIGSRFDLKIISIINNISWPKNSTTLRSALKAGLIIFQNTTAKTTNFNTLNT